jgi:hypothetical protein
MSMTDAIRKKMQQLGEFITDAEVTARNGKVTDMSGLDKDVSLICKQAMDLPPAQALGLQSDMADLIGRLERLSMALSEFKENTKK